MYKKRALVEGARHGRRVGFWYHPRAPLHGEHTNRTPTRPWGRIRKRRPRGGHIYRVRDRAAAMGAVLRFVADWCVFRMTDSIPTLASASRTQGRYPDSAQRTSVCRHAKCEHFLIETWKRSSLRARVLVGTTVGAHPDILYGGTCLSGRRWRVTSRHPIRRTLLVGTRWRGVLHPDILYGGHCLSGREAEGSSVHPDILYGSTCLSGRGGGECYIPTSYAEHTACRDEAEVGVTSRHPIRETLLVGTRGAEG